MVSNQNINKENMLTHRISNMQEDPNNLETWIYKKEEGKSHWIITILVKVALDESVKAVAVKD